MRVRRLDKPLEKIQCQLPKEELDPNTIGWKGYRERRSRQNGQDPSYCMRHAVWEVDGILMCTQHAGMKALEYLEGDRCVNHPDRSARETLDGESLCQQCCDEWARGQQETAWEKEERGYS